MFACILMALMIGVRRSSAGYIERVRVSGCESCQLMLTCRELDSIIAILDADFKAEHPVYDTGLIKSSAFPPDHPRDALNKRCSGLNHCSFILNEDSPGSEAWGAGNITVEYACATRDRIQPYCNSHVKLNELISSGMLHNPGYPRFYAGQRRCVWKISAPKHQKIKLRILDVALFDTRVSSHEHCKDTLEIKDSGHTIFSTCTQDHPPSEVTSATRSVEVVLTSRQIINPRRGVLIFYAAEGCPPPLPPSNGFLMFHNATMASYSCCKGLVFPDLQTRARTIECVGAAWNVSLPLLDCQKPEILKSIDLPEVVKKTEKMAADLLAPILVMVILFALNGFVVYYIHRAKKNGIMWTRSSKFDFQSGKGLIYYYGSMDSERGKLSKLTTKNWVLSLQLCDEPKP